jgi:hypothetical protein
VQGGRKIMKDDNNSCVRCRDENGDDNHTVDADADSDSDMGVQPKNSTMRMVKQSKRKVVK